MKFAIGIYIVALVATLAYSQPITISAKQSINRPSPPVILSGPQRPQPPVKQPTQQQQQQESIPAVIATQASIVQPQKEVPEIIPQRPNAEAAIIEIVQPIAEVVEMINQRPNLEKNDIPFVKPQQEIEYFNGKVIHEPHYPMRY